MAGTPASTLLGVTTSLYFVVLCLFGCRIYNKTRQKRFRWDDYSVAIAMVLALMEWSLIVAATAHGLGQQHTAQISRTSRIQTHHLLFASELLWIPLTAFIRVSIAFTILHFKQGRPWRIILSALIAAQVLFCIINVVFQVVQCIPLQDVWNESPGRAAVCTKSSSVLASQYVHSGIGTATDLILALAPFSFVQRRGIPNREGMIIILLISLGLFATACSILRTTLLKPYRQTRDILQDAVPITIWSILEAQAGLIAANIASLKAPPPPPPPIPQHYSARRRRPHPKSRRTSSTTRTDSYQLPSLHLSLSQVHKHTLGLDTNVSSLTGSSTLNRTRSEEMIWPREFKVEGIGSDGDRHDSPYEQMMAAGGILMTTELDVRSEVLSREGSSDGEAIQEDDPHVRREEWRVGETEVMKGDWSAV
ncbi:hypothetical protein N0V90_008880 [Kalmusia sp. IMI 367209]|nr:hypothetical protein N0V90_008880 [Kalmusia sp. IMI 367209]